ncbi:hypothetical protein C8J56DRAFT_882770 [Mycena floridula]|nr:hypothetical protein C8J56DRAFT_882770 [Mycena floridula]
MSIPITLQEVPASSASSYLNIITNERPVNQESDLLKSIRTGLRGIDSTRLSAVQSTFFVADDESNVEQELTWNEHTVILSSGGVMRKKWNFAQEEQVIQWACIGWLEQHSATSKSTQSKSPDIRHSLLSKPSPERPTFGPFAQIQHKTTTKVDGSTRISAVFVFLRSIGRIFLSNGLEYTLSLPFIVRKAWPITPHGVLIQRLLEPGELEEAELTGDAVLPTIFCVTSPFAEAGAVGLTTGIIAGPEQAVSSLVDHDETSNKPLKSVGPTESIAWVSHKSSVTDYEVLVTVDTEKRRMSIWRYVNIKPKDAPLPLGRSRPKSKRQSVVPRTASAVFPSSPTFPGANQDFPDFPDLPPLSSLPGMAPSLSTTTTMASLVTKDGSSSQRPGTIPPVQTVRGRRNSLTRNDLSVTMDRMVLGGRIDTDASLGPIDQGRMKPSVWMEKLYSEEISDEEQVFPLLMYFLSLTSVFSAQSLEVISVALFDQRWDGKSDRSLMAICLPHSQTMTVFSLSIPDDGKLRCSPWKSGNSAISVAAIRSTRPNIWDLLVVKPDHSTVLWTHGSEELTIEFHSGTPQADDDTGMEVDKFSHGHILSITGGYTSTATLNCEGGRFKATLNLVPEDTLTLQVLQILALSLPHDLAFTLHSHFLCLWAAKGLHGDGKEFECLTTALFSVYKLDDLPGQEEFHPWHRLQASVSHRRFREDPVMGLLKTARAPFLSTPRPKRRPQFLAPLLHSLHTLGENLRLTVDGYCSLVRLVPIICKIALIIRPEWADYWIRICPWTSSHWPSLETTDIEHLDPGLPVWPPDMSAILYGRISNPEWKAPFYDAVEMAHRSDMPLSFHYGRLDPLDALNKLTGVYKCLSNNQVASSQKRAENAIHLMVASGIDSRFLDRLPISIAAPLREAARTCQMVPPSDWPLEAYRAIGRDDVATSAFHAPDSFFKDGYRPIKEFINPLKRRRTISEITTEAKLSSHGDLDAVSGVELDQDDFTEIRFGQDRRLDEVARMLCSSSIPSLKAVERPELNEHDQTKEHQHQAHRIAERTLALPYGRAMFTYGSVPIVTRESYTVPKIEYTIRLQPLNITITPEAGKIAPESSSWGEFHNGVAAGLRISPGSGSVESSWIAFNKPTDLTPEHAGFLFGLGLTGHLKEMMTWHTFGYLTPKHDLTSIGVLLGLAAANVGSADKHVTKLLAVHTPALLPTPEVDLNVSLMTQSAGLAGVGLLYLGTKDRRMAEVCLYQISRRDLVQPDLSNEYREAYTFSAALAFGMIMLGKGTTIPADTTFLTRLTTLIHGDSNTLLTGVRPSFDINLTSPAATIGLGLMYLRTERQDIADILTIPDTAVALNCIQPAFLLMRTLARALIMWNTITPTSEWFGAQIPSTIKVAIEARFKSGSFIDDAQELAYYNIIAGCCFAIGLKFAGTARQEAYKLIIRYYDLYTRLVYANGPTFDHRIKRSAIRDGLNLISISLCMVMAGTGEISCLRRIRYAYGMYTQAMYHPSFKYGIHVATHMSLGLLFLGGGRFTLGTSDAAIAAMVTAFFPRFHSISSDNKSFLQALRHLWVLAVEPRCLIARDVETKEVVYLPLKITMKDQSVTQLVSPTLIPDLDKISSIRVDTPRYWPFHLDMANLPHHRNNLLQSQTLYVKRRSAFLSYTEDPRGSRSLFVRSRASAGEASTLDFPQINGTKSHPAGDLSEFITSSSNNPLFLSFADHFARDDGETDNELVFQAYCHACLFDTILQGKPQSIQAYLTLFRYRSISPRSQYFHLCLQDLRYTVEFYSKIYERRFSGRSENNYRVPLLRDTTVSSVLHALDQGIDGIRGHPAFLTILGRYANGLSVSVTDEESERLSHHLSWYLFRHGVPVSTLLVILKELARDAHAQCLGAPHPAGTDNAEDLDRGIKEVLHSAGGKLTASSVTGWSVCSLDEIIETWKMS